MMDGWPCRSENLVRKKMSSQTKRTKGKEYVALRRLSELAKSWNGALSGMEKAQLPLSGAS